MHGRLFQGAKCENIPKGNLECTQSLGSLEQLADLEEKEEEEESGSSVHGSETCVAGG